MARSRLRLRWRTLLLTLLVLSAAGTMIGLGIWQLRRLGERRVLNARIATRLAEPPIELGASSPGDPAELEYRRAVVRGEFDFSTEIIIRNRSYQGSPGVHVVTPLQINGGESAVLVDRGWIPLSYAEPEGQTQFRVAGDVVVHGVIRQSMSRPSRLLPEDPTPSPGNRRDAWFWLDVNRIQSQMPYPLLPFYLVQSPDPQASQLPRAGFAPDLSDGPHLGYAIQWFSFAAITIAGSIALRRRREE